jgi:putative copper resistance protein D
MEHTLSNPLIAVRDIHFGSTVIVAGIVFFDAIIASPTLRAMGSRLEMTAVAIRVHTALVVWTSLVLSITSGFVWLCLLAARITGKPIGDVIADGTVRIVLSQTQFGFAWQLRFVLGALLATCLLARRTKSHMTPIWQEALAALLAAAYLGSLAFAGHGEEGLGLGRNLHLAADFLHLIAAGLWLGGLVPFALFLVYLRRFNEEVWGTAARDAACRFSNLGIIAVATLLVSGIINASFLIGGMPALVGTSYGRLLLLKVTLFAGMVCLAGINREYLLPRLAGDIGRNSASRPLQELVRNTLIEIALGIGVILIVGMLGIMAPATDMHNHIH